jgi:hypothetical protein
MYSNQNALLKNALLRRMDMDSEEFIANTYETDIH